MNNKSSWTPADRANFTRTWNSYMAGSHKKEFAGKILKQYFNGRNRWNRQNEEQFLNLYSKYPYSNANAKKWLSSRVRQVANSRNPNLFELYRKLIALNRKKNRNDILYNTQKHMDNMIRGKIPLNKNAYKKSYIKYHNHYGNKAEYYNKEYNKIVVKHSQKVMNNILNRKVPLNRGFVFGKALNNYVSHGGRNIEKYQGLHNTLKTKNKPFRNNSNFEKFTNKLANVVKGNRNLNMEVNSNMKEVALFYRHPNRTESFVRFTPYNNKKGVYINFGRTSETVRGQGIGTKLRAYGANAARLARVPLYQYGVNLEHLLAPGEVPVSTRIMRGPRVRAVPIRKILGEKKMYASAVLPRRNTLRSAKK